VDVIDPDTVSVPHAVADRVRLAEADSKTVDDTDPLLLEHNDSEFVSDDD
jgi:hypothetical protein